MSFLGITNKKASLFFKRSLLLTDMFQFQCLYNYEGLSEMCLGGQSHCESNGYRQRGDTSVMNGFKLLPNLCESPHPEDPRM